MEGCLPTSVLAQGMLRVEDWTAFPKDPRVGKVIKGLKLLISGDAQVQVGGDAGGHATMLLGYGSEV